MQDNVLIDDNDSAYISLSTYSTLCSHKWDEEPIDTLHPRFLSWNFNYAYDVYLFGCTCEEVSMVYISVYVSNLSP